MFHIAQIKTYFDAKLEIKNQLFLVQCALQGLLVGAEGPHEQGNARWRVQSGTTLLKAMQSEHTWTYPGKVQGWRNKRVNFTIKREIAEERKKNKMNDLEGRIPRMMRNRMSYFREIGCFLMLSIQLIQGFWKFMYSKSDFQVYEPYFPNRV